MTNTFFAERARPVLAFVIEKKSSFLYNLSGRPSGAPKPRKPENQQDFQISRWLVYANHMCQKKQIACICLLSVLTIENIFIISSRITPGNPYFAVCFAKTLFLNKTILMHNDIFAPATIFFSEKCLFLC